MNTAQTNQTYPMTLIAGGQETPITSDMITQALHKLAQSATPVRQAA